MRASIFVAVLLAVLAVLTVLSAAGVAASVRCLEGDCSDIVGDGLVKDNLGHAHHFTASHHDELREAQRLRRIEMSRRGDL